MAGGGHSARGKEVLMVLKGWFFLSPGISGRAYRELINNIGYEPDVRGRVTCMILAENCEI